MKPGRARLFIKPCCWWCDAAIHWLEEHGIEFDTVDVFADEAAYAEMIRLSGQTLAPVIEVDGRVLADFGPDQLAAFWQELEREDA